jgi:hypothetical protein
MGAGDSLIADFPMAEVLFSSTKTRAPSLTAVRFSCYI